MEEVPLTGSCCGNMPNCGHTFGKTDDEYEEINLSGRRNIIGELKIFMVLLNLI